MSITIRQEMPENIELLAAQRNLYSRAKGVIGMQMVLSGPVAIVATLLAIGMPEFKGNVAIWGICVLLLDIFVLAPWVKKQKDTAARIQELFDSNVLGLEWNDICIGKKPEPELVYEAANRHGLSEERTSSLRKWYPVIIDRVPESYGLIIAQRSNVWCDARMRRMYARVVRALLVLIALGLVIYGLAERKEIFEFLANLVAPLASTYVFGYRQLTEHDEAADRLEKLREASEKVWSEALASQNVSNLKPRTRALQDEIFEHRRKNPPIFDFLFKWFRDDNETLMNKGAEVLVAEYEKSRSGRT